MMDSRTKDALNEIGGKLSLLLPDFFGKVSFNIQDGKYVNSNVEQSIKPNNLKKGVRKC